jgi:hypothetical protein
MKPDQQVVAVRSTSSNLQKSKLFLPNPAATPWLPFLLLHLLGFARNFHPLAILLPTLRKIRPSYTEVSSSPADKPGPGYLALHVPFAKKIHF